MTLAEMKTELARIVSNQKEQITVLDSLMLEVIAIMKNIAPNWIEGEVKHTITRNPEEFSKLTADKIKNFKEEVNSFISNIPIIVDREMSDKKQWPHYLLLDPEKIIPDYYSDRKDNDFFDKKLRGIFSELGSILNKYGLIVNSSKYINDWEQIGQGKFKYLYGLSLDDSATVIFKKYFSENEKFFKIEKSKRDITRKIKEQEAIELWNKA